MTNFNDLSLEEKFKQTRRSDTVVICPSGSALLTIDRHVVDAVRQNELRESWYPDENLKIVQQLQAILKHPKLELPMVELLNALIEHFEESEP